MVRYAAPIFATSAKAAPVSALTAASSTVVKDVMILSFSLEIRSLAAIIAASSTGSRPVANCVVLVVIRAALAAAVFF